MEVLDLSLKNYINLKPMAYPINLQEGEPEELLQGEPEHSRKACKLADEGRHRGQGGRPRNKDKGRLQGKKLKAMNIIETGVRHHTQADGQATRSRCLSSALENSAPIEDTTRVVTEA